MMSAGLIGSPGLGYFKDRYAGEELRQSDAALYEQYKSATPSKFLMFDEVNGLDGTKLGEIKEADKAERSEAQLAITEADIRGDRRVLKTDALIPAAMAVVYLLLLLYFKGIGGYKALSITDENAAPETSEA